MRRLGSARGARALLEKEKEGEKNGNSDRASPVLNRRGGAEEGVGSWHWAPHGEWGSGAFDVLSALDSAVGTAVARQRLAWAARSGQGRRWLVGVPLLQRRHRGLIIDGWVLAIVPGFKSPIRSNGQMHLNLNFKLIQTLTVPRLTFLRFKIFK
jgi:hypothetical protein